MIDNEKNVLNTYQDWVWSTTTPKTGDHGMWWAASGLVAEAGETLALFEKAYRKDIPLDRAKLIDEMGDVMWFLTSLANMADIDLNDVITMNVMKINTRVANGKTSSEG